jgi:hypothetical protein
MAGRAQHLAAGWPNSQIDIVELQALNGLGSRLRFPPDQDTTRRDPG